MSDNPSNFELSDELLSAYLDGELTADERAAVEARLETDPAAQQLLHELRSVSQSVQALPTESLGRDLSQEIIRRARETAPAAGRAANAAAVSNSSRSPDSLPQLRIFNSRRAWIWASLALAAGLLIMFVQSGDEAAKKLPPVAARDREAVQNQPTDEGGLQVRREVSIFAAPKTPSPPIATIADDVVKEKLTAPTAAPPATAPMPREAAGRLGDESDGAAAGSPVAAASPAQKAEREELSAASKASDNSSLSTPQPNQVAADKLAPAFQPARRFSASGGALGQAEAKKESEPLADAAAQQFYVVHVIAKPEALKNRSFDRLLAANQIEFVAQPVKSQSLSFGGGKLAKQAESETALNDQSNKLAEVHAAPTEVVLVEAPPATIELCLDELNKNSNDFLSIAVNEEPKPQDRFDAKSTPAKKLRDKVSNLSQFNRGAVAENQKDTVSHLDVYNYHIVKSKVSAPTGSPRAGGGGLGGESSAVAGVDHDTSGDATWYYKDRPVPEMRRARRIETVTTTDDKPGEPAGPGLSAPKAASGPTTRTQSAAETTKRPMSLRKLHEPAGAKVDTQSDNLKVLFVFTAEDTPASGAAPDNRQK